MDRLREAGLDGLVMLPGEREELRKGREVAWVQARAEERDRISVRGSGMALEQQLLQKSLELPPVLTRKQAMYFRQDLRVGRQETLAENARRMTCLALDRATVARALRIDEARVGALMETPVVDPGMELGGRG